MTISERAGSTTSVGEVGLVITLNSAPGKIDGAGETDGISLTDIVGSEIGSVTTAPQFQFLWLVQADKRAGRHIKHPTQQHLPRSKCLLHPWIPQEDGWALLKSIHPEAEHLQQDFV